MGRPSTCYAEPYSPARKYVTIPGYAGHVSQIRYEHSQTFKRTATRAFTVAEQKLQGPKPNSLVPFEPADLYAFGPNPRRKTNIRNSSSLPFGDPREIGHVTTNVGMSMVPRPPLAPRGVMPGWQDMTNEDRKQTYAKAIRYIGGFDRVKPLVEAMRHKILCRIGGHGALNRAFKWFDLDNSGDIDVDEFCQATSTIFQLDFTDAQIVALFAVYDDDLGGSISYYEFIQKVMADRFNPGELRNTVHKLLSEPAKNRPVSYDVLKPFIEAGFLVMPKGELPVAADPAGGPMAALRRQATQGMCTQVFDKIKDTYTGLISYEKLVELMTHLDTADCPHLEEALFDYDIGDSLGPKQFWEWWQAYVAKFHTNRHKQRAAAEMQRIDADGDGVISQAEYMAAGGSQGDFARFDHDGNGTLDRGELEAMAAAKQEERFVADDHSWRDRQAKVSPVMSRGRDDINVGFARNGSLPSHSPAGVNVMSNTARHMPTPPGSLSTTRPAGAVADRFLPLRSPRASASEPKSYLATTTDQPRSYKDPVSRQYSSYANFTTATRLPRATDVGFVAKFRGSATARGHARCGTQVAPCSTQRPLTSRTCTTSLRRQLRPSTSSICTTGYRL